jgi:hypothetical protein
LDDEILGEHFTRNVQFFGREGQEKIMGAFVIVVGLGVRPLLYTLMRALLETHQHSASH